MDSPQNRVDMLSDEVIWPDQALGRDVAGSKESVSSIDRDMILSYVADHYLPSTTVIGVAGDIDHDEVVDSVRDLLGDWPDAAAGQWWPADNSQDASRFVVEHRKTEQVHLNLAVRGIHHNHPDRFILDVLNLILGEGMSSRLFLEIRERRGLAYDVHSQISHFHDSGSLNVCAGVHPSKVEDAVEATLAEMAALKHSQVPIAEITKAKEMGKGRLMLRMEDTRSVAGWLAGQELLNGHIRTVDEVVSIIDSVGVEDVQRVANDLFEASQINVALVGPYRRQKRLGTILRL
jgi:predicted Zn-dependent peptidase